MASATSADSGEEPTLRRTVGYWQLTFYGLGGMLGAGIYGLIGKAAGQMGNTVWVAFLVSMVAALLTGLSYASIGSRYPRAAGAAYATQRAFGWPMLTYVVGLAVLCSGMTSIAAQSRVAAENLQRLAGLDGVPVVVIAFVFLLALGAIVFRGIRECMWLNMVCTTIEALGLLIVIVVSLPYWGSVDLLEGPTDATGASTLGTVLVLQGAVLTFFSFIGFEDILNVSEEVEEPRRTVPLGLLSAMLLAAAIYMAVAISAVSVVPWRELGEAKGALVEVVARAAPWFPTGVFVFITVFAVTNTALLNWVMGSRLTYGMARQGLLPAALSKVNRMTRTPHVAILAMLVLLVGLMLLGEIEVLASATVLLLLAVFTVVNIALVVLKRRPGEPVGGFEVPLLVPVLGATISAVLIVVRAAGEDWEAPVLAAGLLLAILGLFALLRPQATAAEV